MSLEKSFYKLNLTVQYIAYMQYELLYQQLMMQM